MTPRERLVALEQFGIKLGLSNIQRILDALNHPEAAWPAVHIAGTNGKGSVAAMMERAFRATGQKTGRYTSPHLDRIEERMAIDGQPIDAGTFDAAAADLLHVVDQLRASGVLETSPTFFEVTTALAFELFRRAGVTIGVIEVGLGGRFDATNVVAPAVSVITSIALDHEQHLGTTLGAIAREKAGIIKPGVPVVTGELPGEAWQVVAREAERQGAPVEVAGPGLVEAAELHDGRATVTLQTPASRYESVTLGLNGSHQIGNAVVAVRALEVCRDRGIRIREDDILKGLTDVEWPARLEWLQVSPNQRVLIDAAHNPAGAEALTDYLLAAGIAPIPMVVALMKDKDIDAIVRALAPVVSRFIATEVSSSRSLSAPDLAARIARALPSARITSQPDPDRAIASALDQSGVVVVAGSIFLAGPARSRLIARGATHRAGPS